MRLVQCRQCAKEFKLDGPNDVTVSMARCPQCGGIMRDVEVIECTTFEATGEQRVEPSSVQPSGPASESTSPASTARQLAKTYDPKSVVATFGAVPPLVFPLPEFPLSAEVTLKMDTSPFFPNSPNTIVSVDRELQEFDTDAMLRAPDTFSTDIGYTEAELAEAVEEAAELPTVHDLKLSSEQAEQLRRETELGRRSLVEHKPAEIVKVDHGKFMIKGPH